MNPVFKSKAYLRVIGFLVARGLLYAPNVEPFARGRISINDALHIATHAEPRVFEVLPAAILHFPNYFTGLKGMPVELKSVVTALRAGRTSGPELNGIPYEVFYRWAVKPLKDKRVRPVGRKKIMKSFRLTPQAIASLKAKAAAAKQTESEVLEQLLSS